MAKLELYGSRSCPYTRELRESLLWQQQAFDEYDVEIDAAAFDRMTFLTGGNRTVPVLIEDGTVIQIGWQGRGCTVNAPPG